ncbi:uncharacterized oxidoreductase YrbE isoform X4 [Paramormyrops kingsleyae]|uniref:uncharacterized oxidoreductase YrbE isoform X4 n=1 Tax=Paramormyrops kingsleyae TaxID=1676925 RepID=UPI003B97C9D0
MDARDLCPGSAPFRVDQTAALKGSIRFPSLTSDMPTQVKVIVVGAGSRGQTYSEFALLHPLRVKVVGVADPNVFACKKLQELHGIADQHVFDDWHGVAQREKFADAVFICTPDRLHKEPAVELARQGYHILLEKPMAVTSRDCSEIVAACIENHVMLTVCHVLRYDPTIHKIKELIDSGAIGDLVHIQHLEPGHVRWPVSVLCPSSVPDIETVTEALRRGPYGRCVYSCDNDVCTNQVVNMEFAGGLTAAFTMVAFTEEVCRRKTTIHGSKGELSYDGHRLSVFDFLTQTRTEHTVDIQVLGNFASHGHGVADYHLVDAFVSAVANNDSSLIRSGPEETLASHRLVFEAEQSRREHRVIFCGMDQEDQGPKQEVMKQPHSQSPENV